MHPYFNKRLRPIALVILIFFSCFSIEPWNYAVWAQSNSNQPSAVSDQGSASRRFEEALKAVKQAIEDLDQEITAGKDITKTLTSLKGHKRALETVGPEIRAELKSTESFLKEKGLPAEILDRHTKAVTDYDLNFKRLKDNIDSIIRLDKERSDAEKKKDKKTSKTKLDQLKKRIKDAHAYLKDKVKEPPHTPLDPNNLPHRTPKIKPRKPRLKKEEFAELQQPIQLAFNGDPSDLLLVQNTQDLPKPEDLAEAIEVQFTQEIKDLAASLDHNPVKIYNWVRNNIDFVPTYGSIQGANMCLMTKQCNDMDTASLLIALLRVSGISARYVIGTIEVPIDKVMNWVGGFTDAKSALDFISSGGTPVTSIISGGKISAAQIEHVWVEAYVDYIPSFGAVHKQGDTWIPMDGSYKQYTYTNGIDFQTAVPFDAQGFVNQVESTATINETEGYVTNVNSIYIQTTVINYQTQLQNYVNQNIPNATVGDIIGKKNIIIQELSVLAETPPYKIIVKGEKFSELVDSLRHKISFNLFDDLGFDTVISVTKALPEVAGKKITISYSPFTSSDESLLLSYADSTASSLPAYLINLKPDIRINGQVVSSGGSIGMGEKQQFTITLTSPSSGPNVISNNLTAGTYNAIVLDLGVIVSKQLDESGARANATKTKIDSNSLSGITNDDVIGEFLYGMGLGYWGVMDLANKVASRVDGVVDVRLPSEGIFTYNISVSYLFGAPSSVTPAGFATDIDADTHIVFSKDGDKTKPISFMAKTGMLGSKMEASAYDLTFNNAYTGKGITTAHIFESANQQGIPVYTIDSSNMNTILPVLQVDADAKTDIQNAIASGKIVTVPKTNITKDGWTGTGYLIYDPETGAGAYMISGGLAGGGYTCNCFGFSTLQEILIGVGLAAVALFSPIAAAVLTILASAISFYSLVCQLNQKENLTPDDRELLIAFAGMMFVIGVILAFIPAIPVLLVFSIYWIYVSIVVSYIVLLLAHVASTLHSGYIRRKLIYVA